MILVISEYYGEKDGPAGIVFEKAMKALSKEDFTFYLLSSGRPLKRKEFIEINRHILNIPRIRHYEDKIFSKKTSHPKVGSWGYRALKAAEINIDMGSISLILAWTNPISSLYVGIMLSKKYNIPVIWRFDDPYPPYNYPKLGDYNTTSKYQELEKNWLQVNMKNIYGMSSPSNMLSQWMMKKLSANKITINWPHIGGADSIPLRIIKKANQLTLYPEILNIAYLGRLSDNRNPQFLLEAIEYYISIRIPIKLHIFGRIHENWKSIIKNGVTKGYIKEYKNISFLYSLALMKHFDALILLEAPFEKGVFLPSKFCDYVWAQKPMLISTPHDSVVEKYVGEQYPGLIGYDRNSAIKALNSLLEAKQHNNYSHFILNHNLFSKENVLTSILSLESLQLTNTE